MNLQTRQGNNQINTLFKRRRLHQKSHLDDNQTSAVGPPDQGHERKALKVYFASKKRQANRPKQLYHLDIKSHAWYPLRVMDSHGLANLQVLAPAPESPKYTRFSQATDVLSERVPSSDPFCYFPKSHT
jgi:hypothetical protein